MIGASIITEFSISRYDDDDTLPLLGVDCWRKALIFCYFPTQGVPLLPKTPDGHVFLCVDMLGLHFWPHEAR